MPHRQPGCILRRGRMFEHPGPHACHLGTVTPAKNLSRQISPEGRSDLYLPADFGDSPVTVRWTSGDPGLLDSGGRLGEEIPEEGAEVELEGRLSLQKEELLYIRTLRVYPPEEQKDLSQ